MREMPADILNKAAEHVENMPHRPPFKADMLNAIANAIAEERERCAEAVEGKIVQWCLPTLGEADVLVELTSSVRKQALERIARTIRGTS